MNLNFPLGWVLLGQFPVGDPDGVGSWLLHHDGVAVLLELPPDHRLIDAAAEAVADLELSVRHILVSHDHQDHFDPLVFRALRKQAAFASAQWHAPKPGHMGVEKLNMAGEPLWLVHAPKHSLTDMVTIFRGFAMTGDIELGTIDSVNREVQTKLKQASLEFLASFEARHHYRIGGLVSAHLNDFRRDIDWAEVVSAK